MKGWDYRKAGVSLERGERFVRTIQEMIEDLQDNRVVEGIGGFAGLYRMKEGVIALSCDGVGTKLIIASLWGDLYSTGIDVVAMVVNDLLCSGARPLLFLDYLATSTLDIGKAKRILEGVKEGCRIAGCMLVGGETAEMPGMYARGMWELVGFGVGWVESILPQKIEEGDILVGLTSSGLHSNGFSLVRKVLFQGLRSKEDKKKFLHTYSPLLGKKWGEELLIPTKIYVPSLLPLLRKGKIKGLAHITGGGIPGNLPRILPVGLGARIKVSWRIPPVFSLIREKGRIKEEEMFRVFNMGIGMIGVVDKKEEKEVRDHLEKQGEITHRLGEVVSGEGIFVE